MGHESGGGNCRQAYRLLKRAWQRTAEDVDATDLSRRELVAWCIIQLMEAAGVAKQLLGLPCS